MGNKPLLLYILLSGAQHVAIALRRVLLSTPPDAPGPSHTLPASPWEQPGLHRGGGAGSRSQGCVCLPPRWGGVSRPPGGQSQDRCVGTDLCVHPICSHAGHHEFRLIPLVPQPPREAHTSVCGTPGSPAPRESMHLLRPRKQKSPKNCRWRPAL